MKKAVTMGAVLLLVIFCLTACSKEEPKDKGVLVYWNERALGDGQTSLDNI